MKEAKIARHKNKLIKNDQDNNVIENTEFNYTSKDKKMSEENKIQEFKCLMQNILEQQGLEVPKK